MSDAQIYTVGTLLCHFTLAIVLAAYMSYGILRAEFVWDQYRKNRKPWTLRKVAFFISFAPIAWIGVVVAETRYRSGT